MQRKVHSLLFTRVRGLQKRARRDGAVRLPDRGESRGQRCPPLPADVQPAATGHSASQRPTDLRQCHAVLQLPATLSEHGAMGEDGAARSHTDDLLALYEGGRTTCVDTRRAHAKGALTHPFTHQRYNRRRGTGRRGLRDEALPHPSVQAGVWHVARAVHQQEKDGAGPAVALHHQDACEGSRLCTGIQRPQLFHTAVPQAHGCHAARIQKKRQAIKLGERIVPSGCLLQRGGRFASP